MKNSSSDPISKVLDEYPHIWKTQSALFSWLRGGIRRSLWNNSPIKLEYIKNNRKKIPNPNPKGKVKEVWGATCYLCGKDFPLNKIQVDHLHGNISLNCIEDIQKFIESIVLVSPNDLSLSCIDCHKCKTHAEKQGISFEQALIEKEIIAIIKEKRDKSWLEDRGIIPESNTKKRREQIKKIMEESNGK